MMKVQYYGNIRTFTHRTEEDFPVDNLGALMDEIKTIHGKDALKAMKSSMVTLDGARIDVLRRSVKLPANCTVGIFPLCGGG